MMGNHYDERSTMSDRWTVMTSRMIGNNDHDDEGSMRGQG